MPKNIDVQKDDTNPQIKKFFNTYGEKIKRLTFNPEDSNFTAGFTNTKGRDSFVQKYMERKEAGLAVQGDSADTANFMNNDMEQALLQKHKKSTFEKF